MKRIASLIAVTALVAACGGGGGSDMSGSGSGGDASPVHSAAGSFVAYIAELVGMGGSDTAEPISIDGVSAATSESEEPQPLM